MATESELESALAVRSEPSRATRFAPGEMLNRLTPLIGLVVLFGGWEILTNVLSIPRYLIPKPSEIFSAMASESRFLLHHGRITTIEMLAGFAAGSLFSIAFGLLVVYWPPAKRVIMPYMVVIKTMPKVALAPLFVIWFGFGITTNIIYTALIAFFPVLVNFVQGLEDVNLSEQRLMASYNASKWQMFRHVHFYRSLPYLFAGLKMAAVLALIGAVVSEFVAGDGGLGYYMVQTQNLLRTKEAFAALLILTVMGLLFYLIIDVIHRVLTPWAHDTEVGEQNVL